jgi:membrane protein DedA with SNARE-associated domain
MNNKKGLSFPLLIIAIVLGWTIYKQFNFDNFKFEKPAIAVVYIIAFAIAVYLLVQKNKKKNNDSQPG